MSKKNDELTAEEIIKNKWLVNFKRGKYDNCLGFVLDVSDELTLVNYFDFERVSATGFAVFKNKSVKSYELFDDPDAFNALLVKLNDVRPRAKPEISLSSLSDALRTANENFPLVVIHREKVAPDACWIGKIVEMKKNSFLMLNIDPNAEWDSEPTKYCFKDVTRIEFDNGYERALHQVAEYKAKESRD